MGHQEIRAAHVGVEGALVRRDVLFDSERTREPRRVVDDDVDRTAFLGKRFHRLQIRQIGLDESRVAAESGGRVRAPLGIAARDGHAGALLGQQFGACQADACRTSGDQCVVALELHGFLSFDQAAHSPRAGAAPVVLVVSTVSAARSR